MKSTEDAGVPAGPRPLTRIRIAEMGRKGEGVAGDGPGQGVFVPFTLPGEVVEAEIAGNRAQPRHVLTSSPDRIEPFCPYFIRCGGCQLQHWAEPPYRAWKRELIETALSFEGLRPPVAPVIDAHGAGRRRVKLHLRQAGRDVHAGFMAARTHQVVDIERCPILVPALSGIMPIGREIGVLLRAVGKPVELQATATETGIDLDVVGTGRIDLPLRLKLTAFATERRLARLSLHGDPIVQFEPPTVRFGRIAVVLPPGGFLQATQKGEEDLARLVADAVGTAGSIADLFCGLGPFSLRLAERARVHAVDSHAASIGALETAARLASGLKPVTAERRDLFRRPLIAAELKRFDAIVFDPPRAGAEAQAREIAKSIVPRIVAVSCNPVSFARDARILIDGGYRLDQVSPVDQFKWSGHLELVAIFSRP